MSIALTVNGVVYDYPEVGDTDWGPDATDWAAAVTSGMLQKAGGLFQLLAEVDFGTSYGLKSLYYKSRTANVADSGQIRLARADVINFRNQANSGNLSLGVDASNNLTFNGNILGAVAVTDTDSIDMTLAGSTISADLNLSADTATAGYVLISNTIETDGLKSELILADTDTDGALSSTDWNTFNSKQTATLPNGQILIGNVSNVATANAVTGDVTISNAGVTAIGSGVIVNDDISASAAIAYSKLSLSNSIVSGDISGQISLAKGGTNKNMTAVAGGVVYTDADSMEVTSAGTAGQVLISAGSSAPAWGTDVLGVATNSNAAAGYKGEYTESQITSFTNFPTTTEYGDLTNITLAAGDWEVWAHCQASRNGATFTAGTPIVFAITTTSGNSASGVTSGITASLVMPDNTQTTQGTTSIPPIRMSIAGSTTYYLKYSATYTVATAQARGRICARRIR